MIYFIYFFLIDVNLPLYFNVFQLIADGRGRAAVMLSGPRADIWSGGGVRDMTVSLFTNASRRSSDASQRVTMEILIHRT